VFSAATRDWPKLETNGLPFYVWLMPNERRVNGGIREQSLRFIELVVPVVLNQGARRERLQSFSPALAVGIQSAQPAFVVFYEGNTTDTMKYLRLKNIKTQKSERKKVTAKDEDEKGKWGRSK
jgi:hypothetical protein